LKRPNWSEGRLLVLEHTSRILAGNPLGDPHVRQLHVWVPPQYDQGSTRGRGRRFPVLFDLVGYTGSGPSHTNWRSFDENVPERAARLVHQRKMGPCVIVFPDCFTALGGNQYVNSSALGNYADYLTRELIPFVDREFRTLASRDHRGCFGKSSGGYGAMLHGMRYARFWGAIANHSGDAYFDFVYRPDWPNTLDELAKYREKPRRAGAIDVAKASRALGAGNDDGRAKRFLEHVWQTEKLSGAEVNALMNLCMAATYDPDPEVAWLRATGRTCNRCAGSTSTADGGINTTSTTARGFSRHCSTSKGSRTPTRSSTTPTPVSITGWIAASRFCSGP
jgi:hypothetical protein